MSNLLDKASIILTPTAYNNGEALCVKPSDGSGDFDFSRNSAATRVNAQGLVENVQILSSNLVQNPSFSEEGVQEVSNGSFSQEGSELVTNGSFDTDSDWTKLTGWTISGGSANCALGGSDIFQSKPAGFWNGKTLKVTYTISNYVQGEVRPAFWNPGITEGTFVSANGTYTEYISPTTNAGQFGFRTNSGNFIGSIDNVSVREVGQDWTLGTGWSIGEDKAVANTTGGVLSQSISFVSGKTYKINYEIIVNSGALFTQTNLQSVRTITTSGQYVDYITVTTDNVLRFNGNDGSPFDGSITNISVKEVGQNWENPVYSGDNSASLSIDNNALKIEKNANLDWRSSFVSQTPITYVSGKTYKITYSLKDGTTSGADVYVRTNFDRSANTVNVKALTNDWVEYTDYYVADTSADDISFGVLAWQNTGSGQYYFIDNISIIEISTDTNLPRINYEGFSYQDVLGSEEVVNGGFDNGGANWSNIGGFATFENSSVIFENNAKIYQNVVSDLSKEYNIEIEFSSISGNGIQLLVGNGNSFVSYSVSDIINNGNKINIAKESFIGSGILFIYSQNSSTIATITNVSVKEYLGQEVVPDSGCGSWLFEPQSTNLITQSEALSTMQIQSTVTDNVLKSPTGNVNASIVVENTALNTHGIQRATIIPTNPSATSYTLSIFAKKKERQYIQLGFFTDGVMQSSSGFDLENGTTTGDANTHKIKDFGNGWYRCSFTKDVVQSGGYNFARVAIGTSLSSFYYTGDGASGLYMFGYQLEQGNISSYIPTFGSSVTRNQDLCNNGGSLASINSTSGTLYFEGSVLANDGTTRFLGLSDGTSNNRVVILYYSPINKIRFIIESEDVKYLDANFLLSDITQFHKVAISYKLNDFKVYVDGVLKINDTIGNTPIGLNVLSFDLGGSSPFFGKTKALAVWKEALTDAELTALTTI